jgi:small subunit ribosomal protein S6
LQRYEVIAIVLANVSDEDITALIERSQTIITDRKGVIAKIDKWGKRRLAYEIKKQKDGYYFLIDFAGDGSIVTEIERNYKIDDRILKFITVKKEGASTREGIEQEIAAAEAKRTQARIEGDAAVEGRVIHQIEKASGEVKPLTSSSKKTYNKEEISIRGE